MRFGLSEEQRLLQSTLTRLLEEHAPLDAVRNAAQSGDVAPAGLRDALTEVGVPGLLVPHTTAAWGSACSTPRSSPKRWDKP